MKKKPAQDQKKDSWRRWLLPALTGGLVVVLGTVAVIFRKPSISTLNTPPSVTPVILPSENIALPQPDLKSNNSIEAVLKARRTRRAFLNKSLNLEQVSQMLWSAQGVTVDWGGRTAPSAKSTYPLSVYLIANKIDGLDAGEYLYVPGERTPVHQLRAIKKGNLGEAVFATQNQNSFKDVPAVVIITGNMEKMARAYGGIPQDKDVYLEAGHVAQNMYLQAESLKLGLVANTTFKDNIIRNIITIPEEETIIYLIPFGYPKE